MRLQSCVNSFTGDADPDRFFRRSAWDVGPGDMWRWFQSVAALDDLNRK